MIIDMDEFVGAVKLNSRWRFFYNTVSWWVLAYDSYHSGYDPLEYGGWRAGLVQVSNGNAEQYCEAMSDQEILPHHLPKVVKGTASRQAPLSFVVNFDEKVFVNGWREPMVPVHLYIPEGWTGIEDDPYGYVPSEIRKHWKPHAGESAIHNVEDA